MAFSADILVVEDDKTFSEYLEKILSFNGYNIQLAQTGQDALKCVWDDKADLVLMDIGLPDMDGYSLMERISIESPETPVILMTGNASIESATKACLTPFKTPWIANGLISSDKKRSKSLGKVKKNTTNFLRV
jgi:DNA-binding NtrC family response regulator